jgi:HD-like signal output (HDOD) protein
MSTDWALLREMMNTALDTCEAIEAAGFAEDDRDAAIDVDGTAVTVSDFLTSAWTYPENLRYQIIRDRHAQGVDRAYVPETARIINAMAQAATELIGSAEGQPASEEIRKMLAWYRTHSTPGIERAIAARRGNGSASS